MNKTLKIDIYQDPTRHVEDFFNGWHQFGTVEQISDLEYKLVGPGEKTSQLSMSQDKIIIDGEIPSASFMLIDALQRACESDKVIEGEVIDKNQTSQTQFESGFTNSAEFKMPLGMQSMIKISGMSKAKVILLMILALPLLIIMLPILVIIGIYKVIMFKIRFK